MKRKLQDNRKENQRIQWIDCAKGMTILLVIVGHSINDNVANNLICSFHMPLFFLLSCVTFSYARNLDDWKENVKRSFRHIMIPSMLMFVVYWFVLHFIRHPEILFSREELGKYFLERFMAILFSSASGVKVMWGQTVDVGGIGMLWFMVVLFIGRMLFDFLQIRFDEKQLVIIASIASVVGFGISNKQWLPFCLDIILVLLPLFLVGYYIKTYSLYRAVNGNIVRILICFFIWIGGCAFFIHNKMYVLNIAQRIYGYYPICFVVALAGIGMVSEISALLCRLNGCRLLIYIGKNSFYMFMIHYFDYAWEFLWDWCPQQVIWIFRLFSDIICFGILMLIKYIVERIWDSEYRNL